MLIGEGPGREEDMHGVPFVGRAGQELDQTYLPLAGLDRSEVYVSNVVQCRQERSGVDVRPSEQLASCCAANHLFDEIYAVDPEVIVLLGATACKTVYPLIDLELEHGRPLHAEIGFWGGTIVPMYHPAAGMHETRFMIPLLEDFAGGFNGIPKRGCGLSDGPDYRLIDSEGDLERELATGCVYPQLPCDTETDEGHPDSLQFSLKPQHGRLIKANRRDLVYILCKFAERSGGVVLHNAGQDIDTIERAGGWVTAFRDTMQELYHLGNQPQGLKAAVYRVLGHRMRSYNDVVVPHSKAALEAWLAEALAWASEHRTKTFTQLKKKVREDIRNHESEATLRRIMGKLNDGSDYDPWLAPKWQKGEEVTRPLGKPWLAELEAAVGRMPRRSIVHVPLEEAVQYGCSDADWTGRLATWLEGERKRIVREEWRVA